MLRNWVIGVMFIVMIMCTSCDAPAKAGVVERIGVTSALHPKLVIKLDDGRTYEEVYGGSNPPPPKCVVGARWPDCKSKT